MGLQAHNGRYVRVQQASGSHVDVLQLSSAAMRARRTRPYQLTDEPHTVH